ncbi:MAG: tetratricopeptide repeat protein [Planctomycetota bacterium]|jgi:Flp pilus assembly protein TadD
MTRCLPVLICLALVLPVAAPPVEGAVTIEIASEEAAAGPVPATDRNLNLVLPKRFFRPMGETGMSEPYIAELHYTTDGGKTWEPVGLFKDLDKPFEFTAESEGLYGFFVTLVDKKGRADVLPEAGSTPQVSVTVDWTAPELSLLSPTGGEIVGATGVLEVKWQAKDLFFTETPVEIEYSLDGGAGWQPLAEPMPNFGSYEWSPPAAFEGRMLVRVRARDEVGHSSTATAAAPVLVDTTPPESSLTGPGLSASESVTLEFTASDGEGAGVTEVRLFVSHDNGISWAPAGKAPAGGPLVFEATEGKYALSVSAVDRAGNTEPPPAAGETGELSLHIDTKKPLVRLRTLDLGGSVGGAARLPIQWEAVAPKPAPSPVSIYLSPDDGNTWSVVASDVSNAGTFFWEVPPINSARCRLKITMRDSSGAIGEAVSSKPFSIDSARPTSAIGMPPSDVTEQVGDLSTVLRPLPSGDDGEPAAEPQAPGVPSGEVTAPAGEVSSIPEPTPGPDEPWTSLKPEPYDQPPGPESGLEDLLKAGFAADRAGRLTIAKEYFQRAADLGTGDPRPHAALGRLYAKMSGFNYTSKKQAFEAAIYHFEKAIALGGENADFLNDLGCIFLQTKRLENAENALRRATEIGKSPIYWCNLGITLKRQGKNGEAIEAFKAAVELLEDMKEANFYLAGLYGEAGMWAEARVHYERAVDGYGAESILGKAALSGLQKAREQLGEVTARDESKTFGEKLDRIR